MKELRYNGIVMRFPDQWQLTREEERVSFLVDRGEGGALLSLEVGRGDADERVLCQAELLGFKLAKGGGGNLEEAAAQLAEAHRGGRDLLALDPVELGEFRGVHGVVSHHEGADQVFVLRRGDVFVTFMLSTTPSETHEQVLPEVLTALASLGVDRELLPHGVDRLNRLERWWLKHLVSRTLRARQVPFEYHDDHVRLHAKRVLGLDNLARACKTLPPWRWPGHVRSFLARTLEGAVVDARVKDPAFFRERALLRLYPAHLVRADPGVLHRVDLEGTVTAVVLDLEHSFLTVPEDLLSEIGIGREAAFAVARGRMRLADFGTEEVPIAPGVAARFYLWDGYGSGAALLLEEAADVLGPLGALVAVPTRDLTLCVPLRPGFPLEALAPIAQTTRDLAGEEEGAISPDLYWFHEGRFVRVEESESGPVLPAELLSLL